MRQCLEYIKIHPHTVLSKELVSFTCVYNPSVINDSPSLHNFFSLEEKKRVVSDLKFYLYVKKRLVLDKIKFSNLHKCHRKVKNRFILESVN